MKKKKRELLYFCLPLSSKAATCCTAWRRIGFFFFAEHKEAVPKLFAELILMDVEQVTRQQVFPDQQSQGVKWGWGCTSVTHQNVTSQHYLLAMFQFFSARYTVCLLPTANLF